jgi:hypothetical protein
LAKPPPAIDAFRRPVIIDCLEIEQSSCQAIVMAEAFEISRILESNIVIAYSRDGDGANLGNCLYSGHEKVHPRWVSQSRSMRFAAVVAPFLTGAVRRSWDVLKPAD